MDIRKVKLIELLEESNINEIEINEGDESVRISRNGSAPPMGYATPLAPAPAAVAPAPVPTTTAPARRRLRLQRLRLRVTRFCHPW